MQSKHLVGILCAAAALAACGKFGGHSTVEKGSKIKINYTLTVDGKVMDTSEGRAPVDLVAGSGSVIPGLDEALLGMKAGEKKELDISPDKGYGMPDPKAFVQVPKKAFPDIKKVQVGKVVSGEAHGKPWQAVVSAIGKDSVTLDLNNPLAGKTLHFAIEVVQINAP